MSAVSRAFARTGAWVLRSRVLVRAPIRLYRARLGWLLGPRLLMLEHVGRKTGVTRYVVLEVIDHPAPETYVVASGFGERAQWFRNITANPRVRVYAGRHAPAPATARVLPAAEADRTLSGYICRRPRQWTGFKAVIEETLGAQISETDTPLPMVELRLDART